jgi:hypothetical protein
MTCAHGWSGRLRFNEFKMRTSMAPPVSESEPHLIGVAEVIANAFCPALEHDSTTVPAGLRVRIWRTA